MITLVLIGLFVAACNLKFFSNPQINHAYSGLILGLLLILPSTVILWIRYPSHLLPALAAHALWGCLIGFIFSFLQKDQ